MKFMNIEEHRIKYGKLQRGWIFTKFIVDSFQKGGVLWNERPKFIERP